MIIVPTELSAMFANLIRSYTLSQYPTWRPFAYRFETKASILSTELFTDKPLNIHCRFSKLDFDGPEVPIGTIREEIYHIESGFTVEDLKSQSKFKITGSNEKLAQALSSTKLTVYFLFQKGLVNEESNRELIGHDSNTVPFATRHTKIYDLGFEVLDLKNGKSELKFHGCDEKFVCQTVMNLSKIFSDANC